MRLIDPYAPFFTYKKIIAKYGGEYSFFEKLKIDGVGSPKVSYVSGIPEFDDVHYSDDFEKSMSNFELLKDGLIIRINKKQKLAVAIEKLGLLQSVELSAESILESGAEKKKGKLVVVFEDQVPIVFEVGVGEYEGVERFFGKRVFDGVFDVY